MSPPELFDDDQLPSCRGETVRTHTSAIKALVKRTSEAVIEIGQHLLEVKALLPHGRFTDWLSAEFGWTDRTARRLMAVAETFKTDNLSDLEIAPSALYMLASPSTPEAARLEAIERAEAGEALSVAETKALIDAHPSENRTDDTSFLDAFIDDKVSAESDTTSPHGRLTSTDETTERVKFNLMLLPAERDAIIETLNAIKEAQGLFTHAQALVWLITDWRNMHE